MRPNDPSPKRNTTERGTLGERAAEEFLLKKGYRTVARNVRISRYEIDLIAENKDFLIFVEVKSRAVPYLTADGSSPFQITPAMAVNKEKQRRILYAAQLYLLKHPTKKQPRLDVIEVYFKKRDDSFDVLKIHHIENAFFVS